MKPKSFLTAKDTMNYVTREPTECGSIFASYLSDSGFISKIHTEFKKQKLKSK